MVESWVKVKAGRAGPMDRSERLLRWAAAEEARRYAIELLAEAAAWVVPLLGTTLIIIE